MKILEVITLQKQGDFWSAEGIAMNTFRDIFKFECDGSIKKLIIEDVGNIEFDGSILSFKPKPEGCREVSFNLKEDSSLYIKKIFFSEISKLPLNEQVNSVSLFQNFLKYSYEILSEEFLFIPKEDNQSRIILCKVFIELLEENNLSLSRAYSYTYIRLLELNLKLAEEAKDSNDDLYYALSKWLNACQNYQYTTFEDNKLDREEKINEAIFISGKPKFCQIKVYLKKLTDKNEQFKRLLIDLVDNWYLKSRYSLWPVFIILCSVSKKRLLNLLLPRMLSAIIIGYILLVIAEEAWKLAYNMWNDYWKIISTSIIALGGSFLYLWVEISKIGKNVKRRAFCVFIIGFLESLITGFCICRLINKYYTPQELEMDLYVPWIPCLGNIQVLLLFVPLALFIGIFVQIIWEDKQITHPL